MFSKALLVSGQYVVPFHIKTPTYLPINVQEEYAKVVSIDKLKVVFENKNETLTLWGTKDIGWNNVKSWKEKTSLADYTLAYYQEIEGVKMISWRAGELEYAIDYEGFRLTKVELIKIASSI